MVSLVRTSILASGLLTAAFLGTASLTARTAHAYDGYGAAGSAYTPGYRPGGSNPNDGGGYAGGYAPAPSFARPPVCEPPVVVYRPVPPPVVYYRTPVYCPPVYRYDHPYRYYDRGGVSFNFRFGR